jgi:hypothetical protein
LPKKFEISLWNWWFICCWFFFKFHLRMTLTICATLIRNSRENLFRPLYFKLVPSAPLRHWVAVTATMSLPDFPMCPLPSHEEFIEKI